jgi:hypothetical protein
MRAFSRGEHRRRPIFPIALLLAIASACGDQLTLGSAARLSATPSQVSFGTVPVGRSETQPLRLTNVGGEMLHVSSVELSAETSPAFSIEVPPETPLPWRLAPGETRALDVAFAPQTGGRHEGALHVHSSDAQAPRLVVPVSALDLGARFAIEPTVVDFGAVEPGSSSEVEVTLRNDGSARVEILGTLRSGDEDLGASPLSLPMLLQPTEVASLMLRYAPSGCGADTAFVDVLTSDPNTPLVRLSLAGHTPGPALLHEPSVVRFGSTRLGTATRKILRLLSRGSEPVRIDSLEVQDGAEPGAGASFRLESSFAPVTIAPGSAHEIALTFSPLRTGHTSARLRARGTSCDGGVRDIVLEGGTHDDDLPSACALSASPARVSFGALRPGTIADRVIEVSNVGTGLCAFAGSLVDTLVQGEIAVVSQPSLGAPLAPLERAYVVLRFAPLRAGMRAGRLRIDATDANAAGALVSASVPFDATSGPAAIDVSPAGHDFGIVRTGCVSKPATFTVTSAGEATLEIGAITPADGAPFEVVTAPPSSMPAGARAPLVLRFRPRDGSNIDGAVTIASNDEAQPLLRVPLSGRGHDGVERVDRFLQPSTPKADLLFVIDNSGSMGDEQVMLEASFQSFAEHAVRQGGDYQIGVVTTDTPFLRGVPSIVRSSFRDPANAFRANARVGVRGSGYERGLDMAARALSPHLLATSHRGLLRAGVPLELVFVSDEDDQSPESVPFYLQAFQRAVGISGRMRVSAIAGPVPDGCRSRVNAAAPGFRYIEAAERTGGIVGSICNANFAESLSRLGESVFGLRTWMPLAATPDRAQPMTVRSYPDEPACDADPTAQNGALLIQGMDWSYDATENRIHFFGDAVPKRGACVQARYTLECLGAATGP